MGYGDVFLHKFTFNVAELQVHATATVNGTPLGGQYPIDSINCANIVGTWSEIQANQYFRVERAGVLIFDGVTRRKYSPGRSTALFIQRHHKGDMGFGAETAQYIQDGDVVTVYKLHLPFAFWSTINPYNYVLEKRGTVKILSGGTDSNNNINNWPHPIGRLGPWQRIEASGGVGTIVHDASDSEAWRSKSLTYEWIIPIGGTITVGTVNDASITVQYDPGFYVVACLMTAVNTPDAEDQLYYAYRFIWVVDDTYPDYSEQYAVEIIDDTTTFDQGREMQFRISGDTIDADSLWVGCPILVTYEMRHGEGHDIESTTNQATWHTQQFSGYITEYGNVEDDGEVQSVEVTVSSPLRLMKREGVAPQIVTTADESENHWTKTIAAHMNLKWFIHWLMSHHIPGVLELHDYDYTDMNVWENAAFNTDRGSLWDAIQSAAGYCIGGFVGCTWDGTLVARRDLRYEISASDETYLTGLTEITLDGDDIADRIAYPRSPMRQSYETRSGFFIAGTTGPLTARLVNSAPYGSGRGIRSSTAPDYLALSGADGRDRLGQQDVINNLPTEAVDFKLASYFVEDTYDPALKQVFVTDLNTYNPLGLDLMNNGQWVHRETKLNWQYDERSRSWFFDATLKLAPMPRGQRAKREFLPPVLSMGTPEITPLTTLDLSTFSTVRTGSGTYNGSSWDHGDYTVSLGNEDGQQVSVRGIEVYKALNKFVNWIEFTFRLTATLENDLLEQNVRLMTYDPDDSLRSVFPADRALDSSSSVVTHEPVRFIFKCTSIYIENLVIAIFSSSVDSTVGTYSGAVELTQVKYRQA